MRPARHLDLVFQRGFDQQPDQIVVVQQRAAGDDGAGDLDVVQGQDVNQRPRRPFDAGDAFGQMAAHLALGVQHQGHEQFVDEGLGAHGLEVAAGTRQLAQADDVHQQAFAIGGLTAFGQRQESVGLGAEQRLLPQGTIKPQIV